MAHTAGTTVLRAGRKPWNCYGKAGECEDLHGLAVVLRRLAKPRTLDSGCDCSMPGRMGIDDPRVLSRTAMKLEFTVYGKAEPQGSTRAFIPKGWTRAIITSDNPKLKSWRQELAKAAMVACCEAEKDEFPIHPRVPLQVALQFFFSPPKKVNCPHKTTRPDLDKLMRATLDGMTGIVYTDDSQVAHAQISKTFGTPERVEIYVASL